MPMSLESWVMPSVLLYFFRYMWNFNTSLRTFSGLIFATQRRHSPPLAPFPVGWFRMYSTFLELKNTAIHKTHNMPLFGCVKLRGLLLPSFLFFCHSNATRKNMKHCNLPCTLLCIWFLEMGRLPTNEEGTQEGRGGQNAAVLSASWSTPTLNYKQRQVWKYLPYIFMWRQFNTNWFFPSTF